MTAFRIWLLLMVLLATVIAGAWTTHPTQTSADSFVCTLVIGFSQTQQWYAGAPDFETIAGDDEWQLLYEFGAGIDFWADPDFSGWSNSPVSPCAAASTAPDRVVLTISGGPRSPLDWASAIDSAAATIRVKYPEIAAIVLQPVVGGPNHQVCPAPGGGDVRASTSHPDIDEGIAMAVGGDVIAGASPEVRACEDYEDGIGHLAPDSRGPIGASIAEVYVGGKAVGGLAELTSIEPDATVFPHSTGAGGTHPLFWPLVAFAMVSAGLLWVGRMLMAPAKL